MGNIYNMIFPLEDLEIIAEEATESTRTRTDGWLQGHSIFLIQQGNCRYEPMVITTESTANPSQTKSQHEDGVQHTVPPQF